ncbi:YdcF family protein [Acidocella sp.]|uniref:YdcF family protein n=1 Tax=Acidocella sp. TaxID=50710 RepID=UPI00260FB0F1|nr:YdcF family protein [Acidocella sp.]
MVRRPRRRAHWLRRLRQTLLALAGAWAAGFVLFVIAVSTSAPPNPLPPAGGIVALTGGDDRISTALALLAEHEAPLMLISGAGRGTYLGDFTADDATAATRYAADITLGHMANTTHGNAVEAAAWVHAHHISSLLVVTADYHMPRAMTELRRTLPTITLIPVPVRPPAMHKLFTLPTLRLLASEYTKYLLVRADLRGFASHLLKLDP